ncbi:MAG: hypothetical protein IT453_14560 [Planctomycetes bacterium]|nr:hypothetical protein [Planctomycetota bacterium]
MQALRWLATLVLAAPAVAQWNPPAAQWGKTDPADLRVMSWNVLDTICSTNAKTEGNNNWTACARVVAALRPDVLFVTEAGDNSGNGTGSGVDGTTALNNTIQYFLHGGNDQYHSNTPVTAYVQKYAPGYDLPYVFVSTVSDGFNRNVVLSRFPFVDQNGDGKSTLSDIPNVSATAWAPGGTGGIRGFQFTEIDLPNATYLGDFVFGGAHLKAGSQSSDHTDRIEAAQNVSYFMRYWYNGNGGGTPDPNGKINDSPVATSVLDSVTPIVIVGDWNEDEQTNGTKGPAEWLSFAQTAGGTSDGTDADGTDMTYDAALNYFNLSRATYQSGGKLDYVAWQDSIATLRLATIFNSGATPTGSMPPELVGFSGGTTLVSSKASDHFPVIVDLELPVVDCNQNGVADSTDLLLGTSLDLNANGIPDECECAAPIVYCTSKFNSLLCQPTIASSGSPSASNPAPFLITATQFLNKKNGLLFYGHQPNGAAFQGGHLCVKLPIVRTAVQFSGGSSTGSDCTGGYSYDFNALIQGGGDPTLVVGATLYAQYWARDPQDAFTTSLSDGLQFTICN